jgi:hypothetical protein
MHKKWLLVATKKKGKIQQHINVAPDNISACIKKGPHYAVPILIDNNN